MINLITYILDDLSQLPEIRTYLDLQVLNSLRCGWKLDEIQIRTNFQYVNAQFDKRSIHVAGANLTTCAKWTGIRDALLEGAELIWSHDHDGWQLNPFADIPVDGIRMSQYGARGHIPVFCSASFFLSASALPFVSAFVEYEEKTRRENHFPIDEHLLTDFLEQYPKWMADIAGDLPLKYCYNHVPNSGDEYRICNSDLPLDYLHHKLPITLRDIRTTVPDGFKRTFGICEAKDALNGLVIGNEHGKRYRAGRQFNPPFRRRSP